MDLIQRDDSTDRILRLALLACACDRRSGLTNEQRRTVIDLGREETGVPLEVILPLREPLLAWCKEVKPTLTATVAEQFWYLERNDSHDRYS